MNVRTIRFLSMTAMALTLSACIYIDKKSKPSIYKLDTVVPQALSGNPASREDLAVSFSGRYFWGGIGADPATGFRYLQEAAEGDRPNAQITLANLYVTGGATTPGGTPYVQADLSKAYYWLLRAAAQRYSPAYQRLMQIHANAAYSAYYDRVEACKWALLVNGQTPYCTSLNMTPEMIEQARLRTIDWLETHPGKKP